MEKNYYEILEIDKNASPEIIKKAYNTLAKKYHPDLQPENQKNKYQEKLKLINESYEILSNPEKRKDYDNKLKSIEDEINLKNKEIIDNLLNENIILKNKLNELNNSNKFSTTNNSENINKKNHYNYKNTQNLNNTNYDLYIQELENAKKQAYYDAYIQNLKNRGYKIKYKKSFKDYFKNFISLIITIFILFLLWQIPFIRNFISNIEGLNIISNFIENIFS